ncbi:kinase domain containing protein [Ophiocordyceps sinensis CO18]|uniref:non-specific serine/threonine protein kinase n=1 Tax=Ophiocordyceps sinensis (strain Co18 / CGMCC 3.14243) TaxID=911162 RepID=T5AGS3_OPHSC|nr:kinase domain containing protein [Ophiocordyceps sinensis CO18]
MSPGLLNKRGCPLLEPTPPNTDLGDRTGLCDLKIGRRGSRAWSEIRAAIKGLGRSGRSDSESSTVLALKAGRTQPAKRKGKGVVREELKGAAIPPTPKNKGAAPKGLVNMLGFHSGFDSSATVVLRGSPLKRRSSLHALAIVRSDRSSEPASSASSDGSSKLSTVGNDSTRKTSIDSRFSDATLMRESSKRRRSRRNHWSKSSPDGGTLQKIDESAFQAQPTVLTVERAAAAKVFLETHYNELLNRPDTRSLRRQYLESQLYYSPHLTLDQKEAIRLSFFQQESCHVREARALKAQSLSSLTDRGSAPNADRYQSLKVLGKGSFGVVKLVRERPDPGYACAKQVFAMKVIRKSNMIRYSQEGHLRAERDFLVASEGSTWLVIVPLIASFQDPKNLYLVMEYMPGGDFLGLLVRSDIMHESIARFYIAEMILAVEEAHRLRFIHRDIKPDNFLISASGHLKISDFGLSFDGHWSHDASYYGCQRYSLLQRLGIRVDGDAKDKERHENISTQLPWLQSMREVLQRHDLQAEAGPDDLQRLLEWRNTCGNRVTANSVVGTSQYMAPEVIRACRGTEYDGRCDWGRKETKENITNHRRHFFFPRRPVVSDKCKDLINHLIQEKEVRLCSKQYHIMDRHQMSTRRPMDCFGRFVFPNDAEDIRAHRWFKHFPWDRIHTISPPFVPNIASMEDTHYFDESEPIESLADSSCPPVEVSSDEVRRILHDYPAFVQNMAIDMIADPLDSAKLRSRDDKIERTSRLSIHERDMLKHFIRVYAQKEPRRPRDILLRDESTKDVVMEVRKKTAFMGYTWRRMRPGGYTLPTQVDWLSQTNHVAGSGAWTNSH